jgi:hypothetical protein
MWRDVGRIRSSVFVQKEKFFDTFKDFYMHDAEKFFNCQKLVRPANVNEDIERNWFFTYIQAFMLLEKNGYYYSCESGTWNYKPQKDFHTFVTNQLKEIRLCKPSDFEKMFDRAVNYILVLKNQGQKFYRYVEYDSQLGGSHQKIFSWLTETNKRLPCDKENISSEIFPTDVFWPAFKADEPKANIKQFP